MSTACSSVRSFRLALAIAAALAACSGAVRAEVVTLGLNPTALPNCPDVDLPGKCAVDTAAQVIGGVGGFSAVRIGQGGQGSLLVGNGATLIVDRTDLAPGIPFVPDVVVGDNVGSLGSLTVQGSGRLVITVPDASPLQGGLLVGPFAAPQGPGHDQSTRMAILNGGEVQVNKIGGLGVGSAVFVGVGAGSHSSLVLDGGIGDFGSPALGARLITSGNLSIGRLGTGTVFLARNADVSANLVLMSTVREGGVAGTSSLGVDFNSTLNAQSIFAGIGLGGPLGYDPDSPNHGSASISTRAGGRINAHIVLGEGGTLGGSGILGGPVSNFGGIIKPGFSPGTLTILGDYLDVGGRIEIEIGPNGADFIDVGGNLSLDGTSIEFKFIDGFAPDAGFRYDFIDADGVVDVKGNVTYSFSGLQPGFLFDVSSNPSSGVLSFTARTDGTAIPEPALPALLGLAGLAAWAARRTTRASGPPGLLRLGRSAR